MPKPRLTAMIRSRPITLSERVETGSDSAGCLSPRLSEGVEQHGWSALVRPQLVVLRLTKGRSQHDNHPKLKKDPCRCEEGRARIGMPAQSPENADQTCTELEKRFHHHKKGTDKSTARPRLPVVPKKSRRRLYKSQP
jgi:hypothetical protein